MCDREGLTTFLSPGAESLGGGIPRDREKLRNRTLVIGASSARLPGEPQALAHEHAEIRDHLGTAAKCRTKLLGKANVEVLRQQLPKIREKLGFTIVTTERQLQQYARYQRIFRNRNNSIRSIIARRWTSLQLSEQVVTTIRLRDPALTIPTELATTPTTDLHDIVISGRVTDADSSNLFPRKFTVVTDHESTDIYILW